MKRFLWLGLVFLSICWLFFIPIFSNPDYLIGVIFLTFGILFSTIAFYKHDIKKINQKYLIIIFPLLLSLIFIPFPYNLGMIILTIGTLLYVIKNYLLKIEKFNWIFLGLSFSGIILMIQMLFFPIYSVLISHGHRVDALSSLVSSIANLFGLQTSVNDGLVFVQTFEGTFTFTTTWEKLGLYPWFNILIGALIIFIFLPKAKKIGKYILGFILFSIAYLILRYVFAIYVFTQTTDVTLFWDILFLAITFIPFALILMKLAPFKNLKISFDCFKSSKIKKNQMIAMLLIFIFMFSLVGAFVFHDPGTEKQGRILIDEFHSEWENSARDLDKEWYGMLSTYNYYSWAEWLDKYYKVDRNIDNYLTTDLLNNYDILILKCPTNLYSDQEIIDIVQFVKDGGGLYLIGDHTNVFGMNYYLNHISENFGITFKTDATYELGSGMTSTYEPFGIFPHPVIQNMDKFHFLTSCTLSAPLTSENVIIGNKLLGEPGTYSTENFFRESISSLDMEYGLLLQVAAVKHGSGRVLAFTDSTCFSNFCVFMDGYQSFNLGAMEYLNRTNSYNFLNTVFVILSSITFILALAFLKKEGKTMILFMFILVGLLAFSIATPVFSHINNVNYQVPEAHSDYNIVSFDLKHSDVYISHSPAFSLYDSIRQYDTFFVWTQRVGCYPSLETNIDDAVLKGDSIVIINPTVSFNENELTSLTDYIKHGGNVLLMDGATNLNSTANELLEPFGLSLSREENISSNGTSNPYLMINNSSEISIIEMYNTSIGVAEIGNGKIVVVVDSYDFSNEVMGNTFEEPDTELREIYDTEFYIFEEILLKDS